MSAGGRTSRSSRRTLAILSPFALGILALIVSFQIPQPFDSWLGAGGAILLVLVAPMIFVLAAQARVPHPEFLASWRAFAHRIAGGLFALVVGGGLIIAALLFLIIALPLRLLRLRSEGLYRWYPRAWRVVWRFGAHQMERALAWHRAAAMKHGAIIPESVLALGRTHQLLAQVLLSLQRQELEGEEGRVAPTAELTYGVAPHARMALFYAQTFRLPTERGLDRLTMYVVLAQAHLVASLQPDAEDRLQLQERGLAALAEAVEIKWVSPEGRGRPAATGSHLVALKQLAQRPELQQDVRLATLLEMLQNVTTALRLTEMRAQITPQTEEDGWSPAESEEREWVAGLVGPRR